MNGIDFPVARVLDGIDAAIEAGLAPVKVNMVVRRGVNEDSVIPMASWARETGVILRFIEYMDVGHSNGWRLDEVVPAADLVDTIAAAWPIEPAEPAYRGEVAGRWRYVDGARRVRGHLVGDPAVLPRLHARADLGRGQALHVPVRGRGSRPPRGPPLASRATRTCSDVIESIWLAPRRPLFRAALGGDLDPAQDRDVRDGRLRRLRRRTRGFSTACPQASTTRGWRRRGLAGLRG